jgi:hypothetical protein
MGDKVVYRRQLIEADSVISTVFAQYDDPINELFDRYLKAAEKEREILVLALITRIKFQKKKGL